MASEPLRLLARRSERGYTERYGQALHDEAEAVPAEVQDELTAAAHRRANAVLGNEWLKTRSRVVMALEHFVCNARPDPRLQSDLRVISRVIERVDRRLSGGGMI